MLDNIPEYLLDIDRTNGDAVSYAEWFDAKTRNAKELCAYAAPAEPQCENFNPVTGRVRSEQKWNNDDPSNVAHSTTEYLDGQGRLIAKVESELPESALGSVKIAKFDASGKAAPIETLTGINHDDYYHLFYARNYENFEYWVNRIKHEDPKGTKR